MYDHEPAWIDTAVRYLAEGARGNDQILYVADKPEGALVDDLAGLPFQDSMLHSGQLEVLCLGDAYNATRGLVAIDQIAYYRSRTAAATDAGGFRLACEASSLAATPQEVRRLTVYELLVDSLMAQAPMSAMCAYDRGRISASATNMLSFMRPLCNHGQHRGHASLPAGAGRRWRLTGEVDIASLEELELGLSAVPTGDDVHLQLGELDFIDVVGPRALTNLAERLAPSHRLVLHEPPGVLRGLSSWRGGTLRASS